MNPTLKNILRDGVRYRVTSSTRCGTLQKGDCIRVNGGTLECVQAGGWLEKGTWERFRCGVELDEAYLRRRIQLAREEISRCEAILSVGDA